MGPPSGYVLCSLVLLCVSFPVVECARILLIPFPWQSHVFKIFDMASELHRQGHEISAILPPSVPFLDKARKLPFDIIVYHMTKKDFYSTEEPMPDDLYDALLKTSMIDMYRIYTDGLEALCSNPLSDDDLFQHLRSKQFDLAFVDAYPTHKCFYVIPYRLGIPYVSFAAIPEPWVTRSPALPSFVPFAMAEPYTEKMTFRERLMNAHTVLDWNVSPRIPYLTDKYIAKYIPDKPAKSLNDLARASKLWFLDTDTLLDYPQPMMPNEINIGGLSTKLVGSLPGDLKIFADSAKNGLIVVSFGSFDFLTANRVKMFLDGFKQIPQHVVFRSIHHGSFVDSERPDNVRLMPWIPQNDLLGHPNAKLFITHCGVNGQFEALYHAVPMLGFPMFTDQPYNARRMKYHGYGEFMDILATDTPSLVDRIQTIIANQSYYDNIRKASEIFRSQPTTPKQRAVYWMEQVLADRVDHLHSYALDMPWYEYLMIDILAVVGGSIMILIIVGWTLICHIIKCWKQTFNKTKVE